MPKQMGPSEAIRVLTRRRDMLDRRITEYEAKEGGAVTRSTAYDRAERAALNLAIEAIEDTWPLVGAE